LIADPGAFGEVLTNVVGLGNLAAEDGEDEGASDAVS
jgi:hypothetical protein